MQNKELLPIPDMNGPFTNLKDWDQQGATKCLKVEDGESYEFHEQPLPSRGTSLERSVKIAARATLSYVIIADFKEDMCLNYRFDAEANAHLSVVLVVMPGRKLTGNLIVNLNGEGATAQVMIAATAMQHSDYNIVTTINNHAPFTEGQITQRAVVGQGATNNFTSVGYIKKGATKAVSKQESRILLLDGAKKGEVNPLLLIDHFDVIAGHAASSGRVNPEHLFYLKSRGIEHTQAEKLITISFLQAVIDQIDDLDLKEKLSKQMRQGLGNEK